MKQTNNAIKFLMAQYRAIFKNAYFKGLATAALVTAGLAVGAAQAATVTLPSYENGVLTNNAITSANANDNVIIDGEAFFNSTYSNKASATSITITNGGSLSTYHPEGGNLMGVGTSITLNGGSLNLTNSWVQGLKTFTENPSGFSATLTSNGNSEINLKNSLFQVGSANLNEGTTVNIGGVYPGAVTDKAWNTASAELLVQASGAGNASTIVINGADINIDDDGLLSINNNQTSGSPASIFTMNAGTITLTGSELARRAKDGSTKYDITQDKIGAAIVSTNSAVANFNGGQIIVGEGDVGQIHGNNMHFKGTTFENAGTMQIGGRLTVKDSLPDLEDEAQNIKMTAGAINNSGVLLLGSAMSYDGQTLVSDKSTITAEGGTITNSSDGEIQVHSKLVMKGRVLKIP